MPSRLGGPETVPLFHPPSHMECSLYPGFCRLQLWRTTVPLVEAVASGAVSPFIHLGGCGPDQK